MSSLTLNAKRNCDYGVWQGDWNGFDFQNMYDITTGNNDSFRAAVYRASLSVSAKQKLAGCSVKVNLQNMGSVSCTATVYCYLYTSDPTTGATVNAVPSGYIKSTSASITLAANAGKYQTFSFSGLNITSGSNLYFLFTTNRGAVTTWYIELVNWNNGTSGFGTPTVTGTFSTIYSLSVSPATVTAGGKVTLTVSNGNGTSFSATIKSGSTTLATQSFSTGSVQIACPQSWFVTAGKASSTSMSLSVTVTGDGQTLMGSFTLSAKALSLSVSPASVATGGSVTLTVANGNGYSLTATIKYGSTTLKTQAFTTGSVTITCPKSWFTTAGNTTGKSLSLSVSVTGGPSTLTGSFTLTAGDDMKPSAGTPAASVVDLTGNFPNTYIAGYSKVKVAATVSTGSNAGISTVKLSYPGGTTVNMSLNSSTGKYEATTAAPITGNTTFTVTVTDTRGLSGTKTVSVTGVVPYTAPSITIDTGYTYRCNASGTKASGGTYYRVKATANYYSSLSGNSLVKFSVKIKGASAETNLTSNVQSGAISGMSNPLIRYTIVITIRDKVSAAVTREYTLEGVLRNIVVKRSGDGTYLGVGVTPTRTSGASCIELPTGGSVLVGDYDLAEAFYYPGTYTGTDWQCTGYLTGSAKTARLVIIPEKSLAACSRVKVTEVTGASIRVVDGNYIGGGSERDLTSYIAASAKRGGTIIVDLTNSSGWGFTNSTPLSGQLTVTFTVT